MKRGRLLLVIGIPLALILISTTIFLLPKITKPNPGPKVVATKVVTPIHSACPAGAGTCVGQASGDMDADGHADRVGITWQPKTCQTGTPSSCQMVAHIILDSGHVIDTQIPWNYTGEWNVTSLQFLGLSDVNGNGRDEIFLELDDGCEACSIVIPYELHQGTLQPLDFPGVDTTMSFGLSVGWGGYGAGFTCHVVNGLHQVLYVSWPITDNMATEQIYQANPDGTESLIRQDTAAYTQQQLNALGGAHCPGLSNPSN